MKKGTLEMIVGCMSSGKSEELMRRLRRAKIAGKSCLVLKPAADTRNAGDEIMSRSKSSFPATAVSDCSRIAALVAEADVIGIDEVNLFPNGIIESVREIIGSNRSKRVIACGLDTDFRGEPFMVTARLMAIADKVDKLSAICVQCRETATLSQRLIDGRPAPADSQIVLIGGDELYEARCRDCHEVPPAKAAPETKEIPSEKKTPDEKKEAPRIKNESDGFSPDESLSPKEKAFARQIKTLVGKTVTLKTSSDDAPVIRTIMGINPDGIYFVVIGDFKTNASDMEQRHVSDIKYIVRPTR